MVFYEVELLSAPKILFACSVETEKYRNTFYNKKDFLEISVCEEGHIIFEHKDKKKEIAEPGMIVPILRDANCDTYSFENEKQRHTTVGVRVRYNLKRYENESECDLDIIEERIKTGNIILIPCFYDPGEKLAKIMSCLKEIISNNFLENPDARLNTISGWYKLCAMLTEIVCSSIRNSYAELQPAEHMYVKKALQYIGRINKSQLSVSDIADHLNISEGYLHRIFKKTMDCTILEYINRQRILLMIELVENKNLTLREAAYNVGVEDPAYASRLFRKVMGVSFREYFA